MNSAFRKQNLMLSIFSRYTARNIVYQKVCFPRLSIAHTRGIHSSFLHNREIITPSISDLQEIEQGIPHHETAEAWLPFQYQPPPKENFLTESGDFVQHLEYDPTWPKPNYEFSEELKTASDDVKYKFSLAVATKDEIKEVIRRKTLERVQRYPGDLESLEVLIALRTIQIRSLFEHLQEVKKEIRGKVLLEILIKKRFKQLKILRRIDMERFNWICKELKVYYSQRRMGGEVEIHTRKHDLRRLTKQYCTQTIEDKKKAYHVELKKQQEEFLKEKAEILAWIEKEENELANLTI